jgi:DGQHR domain-containing protein
VYISGIKVRQWLQEWDQVPTDSEKFQSPPPKEFYLASIKASQLKALSDVHQRDASAVSPRQLDTSIQRSLEEERTAEIAKYIKVGFPLSSLGSRNLPAREEASLRKPGWLPTAIIANVLPPHSMRGGQTLHEGDAVTISESGLDTVSINLPTSWTGAPWKPRGASPLEIIDGQHRLSAFDEESEDFDLPVVIFYGLDFSWQAYLFWTVNIKPKKINASLAFDLYPLLREQDWLEAGESLNVYRETRAQELVEALWGDPTSIWFDRINMLGERGMKRERPVTQAAFVRSLTSTFVRSFRGNKGLGGLFGGAENSSGLDWPRAQQSALLISAWNFLAEAVVRERSAEWAVSLRNSIYGEIPMLEDDARNDPALTGTGTLLASDQGVRGFHMVLNDVLYLGKEELDLRDWSVGDSLEASTESQFADAVAGLSSNKVGHFLRELSVEMARFDWRNSKAQGLTPELRESKQALRGSSGYNVLRARLLRHLAQSENSVIALLAGRAEEAHGA